MSRLWCGLLLVGLVVGCGKSKSTDEASQWTAVETESETGEGQSFSERFKSLTEKAQKDESMQRWDSALKTWQSVVELTTTEFGGDSWQAQNARLAAKVVNQRKAFTEADWASLNQIAKDQNEAKQCLQSGRIDRALELSAGVIERSTQLWGGDSHVTANFQLQHAQLLRAAGLFDQAASELDRVIEKRKQILSATHPDYQHAIFELGMLYSQIGQTDLAIERLEQACQAAEQIWGADSNDLATAQNELGVAQFKRGDYDTAESILQSAAKIRRDKLGANSAEYAHSLLNLGVTQMSLKQLDKAAESLAAADAIFAQESDNQAHDVRQMQTDVLSNLGTVYLVQQEFDLAEAAFEKLVKVTGDWLGTEHPVYAGSLFKLAIALGNQGKYETAEPVMLRSLEIQRKVLSPQHPDYVRSLRSYAQLLERTGRANEAKELMASLPEWSKAFR